MPSVLAIAHVNLSVEDVEASRAFYEGLLGLAPAPRPAEGGRPGAWYRVGDVELHLSVDAITDGRASRRHVCLVVDDLDAMRAHLEAAGVTIEGGSPMPGVRRFFVRDPSGNRLEIVGAGTPGAGPRNP